MLYEVITADMSIPLSLVGQKGSGRAAVHALVKGALTAPDLTLDINADNLASNGFQADELLCKARMDKGLLQVQELTLQRNQGTLNAGGTLMLGGKKGQEHPLDVTVDFNRLELDELAPELGARGAFSGKIVITSYSIHYTKLYEPTAPGSTSARQAGSGSRPAEEPR